MNFEIRKCLKLNIYFQIQIGYLEVICKIYAIGNKRYGYCNKP